MSIIDVCIEDAWGNTDITRMQLATFLKFKYLNEINGGIKMQCYGRGKDFTVDRDTLLVCLDESGDPKLGDPNHPLYGLGGCFTYAKNYFSHIHKPWHFFLKENLPNYLNRFHSAGIRFRRRHLELIAAHFAGHRFGRFSIFMHDKDFVTKLDRDPAKEILRYLFAKRFVELVKPLGSNFTQVLVIYEKGAVNEDGVIDELVRTAFKKQGIKVPVNVISITKEISHSGLQISDYILYAASKHIKKNRLGIDVEDSIFDDVFCRTNQDIALLDEIGTNG